ncbi:type II toxin-antitoxin system mRNA interferase toxin, RelE/StbE family [Pseudomonas sp. CFBP13508]|jgi:mRNA interferase RelE/StbE|uniref:Type II toxin-antitoxin system RelE/ParE family toxin n=2 Tax=Pseudomonas TaxID=286 RepID=A0ABT2Y2Q4_9PSED|nr:MULTISPECIES: type II toxin-antitoxin system RelE/ParE family toxin [Pseudomonas]KAB2517413.1 type II toxin-antitoxin system RelE/ParE family toxin [Pseudomonas sp. GXM4]MBR7195336.1 type II toxin-antitoxin system RelE/ParE family toxin [Pseudomonas sp. 14A]MBV4548289.1 type II toxin-antitoxin system RelE/ParE family toxin [Pseudomonas triticicola]MCV2225229.1 type II toxin-antitoxin system RelE/ParE family toxin [Pseudomonas mercuritolerans]TKJ70842.1 type II toxin-antitoxin system mRNA in
MTYKLEFLPSAHKEWNKLGHTLREQFKKKLGERLKLPRIPADALHGMPDCYKIKLKASGYRLVYQVIDERVVVSVLAVGKRERSSVYDTAKNR